MVALIQKLVNPEALSIDSMRVTGMRTVTGSMWLVALGTLIGDLLVGQGSIVADLLVLALPIYPTIVAVRGRTEAPDRMITLLSVVVQETLMLYIFRGMPWQIDLHLVFFASLAMAATLLDWKALTVAAGYVVVHHMVLGLGVPDWVFLGGGGLPRILLHGTIWIAEWFSLVVMVVQIVALLDSVKREAQERQAVEATARAAQEERDRELTLVIAAVSDALTDLADGDLSHEFETQLPESYRVLGENFNATIGSLRALVGSVLERADAIRHGSTEIAQGSDNLARRSEINAANVEETTASIVELDKRLRAIADAARDTVSRAGGAISSVGTGRDTAGDAVEKMNRVHESARGIDEVIEGLDKIAFQTRVLAMNAAVEAGRAGEAGRGFAVVADLVSALAMRAEEEAKNARDQLSATQADIAVAVEAVGRVGTSLSTIVDDVSEVHDRIASIAEENQAQATVIKQISTAVTDMDRNTQENAAMVEQSSAAVRVLMEQGQILSEDARRFRLPDMARSQARSASNGRQGVVLH
ncbi:methyl-accepting chemotaxis protein [Sphingosinithalassobacter portus]|uniref:methyl-accepting chemotaxis protein n=1 Tax=Stakelama portus TaxID=2676234 RepID=UPI001EFC97FF|nr:methyl-accepting chemotaxis protein [Sphingosinithalassobacter portus]